MTPPAISNWPTPPSKPGSVCQNCHDGNKENHNVLNQKTFTQETVSIFQCPTEPFWSSSLRVPQDYLKTSPYLRNQNKLETLIKAKAEEFPIEFKNASLEFYLGLKGPLALPKWIFLPFSLQIPNSTNMCLGNVIGDLENLDQCSGLTTFSDNQDFGFMLQNLELLQWNDFQIGAQGIFHHLPSLKVKNLRLEEGRILLAVKISDPLWNSAIPQIPSLKSDQGSLSLKPNPYDSTLYDLDITPLLINRLTVAYHPKTRLGIHYEEYTQNPATHLKVIPYFLEIAREQKLPPFLSIPELYKALIELNQNVDKTSSPSHPLQDLISKSIHHLLIKGAFKPSRFIFPNFYLEFDSERQNSIPIQIDVKNTKDLNFAVQTPIEVKRILFPKLLDIQGLRGILFGKVDSKLNIELKINNLDLNLGQIEYFRKFTKAKGALALTDGSIHSETEAALLLGMPAKNPAFSLTGNLATGLKLETHVKFENLTIRVPFFGKISFSGVLKGKAVLVPKVATTKNFKFSNFPAGWSIKPDSTSFSIENLKIIRNQTQVIQKGKLEIAFGQNLQVSLTIPQSIFSKNKKIVLKLEIPSFFDQGGEVQWQNLKTADAKMIRHLGSGFREIWDFHLAKEISSKSLGLKLFINARETEPTGKFPRILIENLATHIKTIFSPFENEFLFSIRANRINFPMLHFIEPSMELNVKSKTDNNGRSTLIIPHFRISANLSKKRKPTHGLLQGPIKLYTYHSPKRPLTSTLDKVHKTFSLKNLKFRFKVFKIIHEKLTRATRKKIKGVDLDGRLIGHWLMNYETFKGKGRLAMLGDGEGDIHLIGRDGERLSTRDPRNPNRLVETPLLSKTRWQIRRLNGIDFNKQIIEGPFTFYTQTDPTVAKLFGIHFPGHKNFYYRIPHNHMPYTLRGFEEGAKRYMAFREKQEMRLKSRGHHGLGGIEP